VNKTFRSITALGAVLFALFGLSACGGGGIPGDAVAKVGSGSITKVAFEHWMKVAAVSTIGATGGEVVVPDPPSYSKCIAHLELSSAKVKGAKPPTSSALKSQCETQYKTLLNEVMGYLIASDWVLQEGKAMGIKLSDKEVHKRFEDIKNEQFPKAAEFEKFLKTSGQTVSDLLLRVKLNLMGEKVQSHVVKEHKNVTEAEVKKFYEENKSRFGTPEKRAVYIVLTKTEAAAKSAKQEIESGKSFSDVAKKDSIDPTSKSTGGLLPEVIKGEEEKPLDEAIFSAKTGVLSGPVKTNFGYYIFQVKSVKTGNQQTLAQAKKTIKAEVASSNESKALSAFTKDFKKRWTAKTECLSQYAVLNCKGYKAPKTTSTESTVSGATSTASTPTTSTSTTTTGTTSTSTGTTSTKSSG
jgi:foldase protein PrsA